jgi:hypothetical protein
MAVVACVAPGCGADDSEDVSDVSAVLESAETATLAQALVAADGSPEDLAEQVARHALGALYPAACATKSITGRVAHLQLVECTGPFGKRKLSGGVDFTLGLGEAGTFTAAIASSADLTANGRPMTYAGTASWRPGSAVRWSGRATGTSMRGRAYDKTATLEFALDLGKTCATMNGTVEGIVAGRSIDVTVTDYRVCKAECPSSGRIVKTKEAKNGATRTKRITFNGSAVAEVVDPRGVVRAVPLVCGEDAE